MEQHQLLGSLERYPVGMMAVCSDLIGQVLWTCSVYLLQLLWTDPLCVVVGGQSSLTGVQEDLKTTQTDILTQRLFPALQRMNHVGPRSGQTDL